MHQQLSHQAHQNQETTSFQGGFQQVPPSVVFQGTPVSMNSTPIMNQGTTQIINTTSMMIQEAFPQSIDSSSNERVFPVRKFKILGGLQIGVGGLLCLLSLVGVIIHSVRKSSDCAYSYFMSYDYRCYYIYRNGNDTLFAFDITCLILSGWFIVTGLFPMCMTRKRQSSWRCLKLSFMVFSIVGASLFVPTIFILGVVGSLMGTFFYASPNNDITTILSISTAALSFVEIIMAIVSASYCCCCTQWETTVPAHQGLVYIGRNNPQVIMIPRSQSPITNTQPVVMGTRRQQYTISQQHLQDPLCGNMFPTAANNLSMDPPPYKE